MNAKIPVFVICVQAIICLLLYNFHDCTFNIDKKTSLKTDANSVGLGPFLGQHYGTVN